ncbi:zinc-dependent alcohol dehydrogenase [Brassicibacter mesophilus]|uniref:zinc-dependent alcohol dehydrogenase n=1 Tax=Brassicibacter mesophilus TaxID=745119 RepID=UPI003D20EB08
MFKIKALYFPELNKVDLRDVDKPAIKNPTDVLVKVTTTTICGSDIHIIKGLIPTNPGFVLGHEYVGIIEEVGEDVKNFKVGDRVIGPPAPYCGKCEFCKKGYVSHCKNGGVHGSGETLGNIPGVHAEYTCVPHADSCLLKVPKHLTDEQVIFISDIASTGYTGVAHCDLQKGETIVIFGCGPVGMATLLTAKLHNPNKIIVVEKSEKRLKKALELGATHAISATGDNVLDKIAEYTDNKGADVVIDAVGLHITINQGIECLGVSGRMFLVGIPSKAIDILPNHFYKNISFQMGLGDLNNIKGLLDNVSNGKLDLTPLITHTIPLDDIENAIELVQHKPDEVIKVIIKP